MREYEIMAVYDLAVAEAGGADASTTRLTEAIERAGGTMLKTDHWGRRRMAYPINEALDGDYIVSRFEIEPLAVATLNNALNIDESVYRYIVVRADELPPPRPEPVRDFRGPRPGFEGGPPPAGAPAADAPAADAPDAAAPAVDAPAAPAPEGFEAPAEPSAAPEAGEDVSAAPAPEPGPAAAATAENIAAEAASEGVEPSVTAPEPPEAPGSDEETT